MINIFKKIVVKGICPIFINYRYVSYKMKSKHYNPRFRFLRAKKFVYTDLVDTDLMYKRSKLTPEEIRSQMKKEGVLPYRPYIEKPITISCTSGVLEPFIPPEGDGVSSNIKGKAIEQAKGVMLKGRSMLDVQKIKKIDPEFSIKLFPSLAHDIYIRAHHAMMAVDEKVLHELVTEKAYVDMTHGLEHCTVDWKFCKSIEPPKIVHARVFSLKPTKSGPPDFGQITVRLYTRQRLAIYDRFGRLKYGACPTHVQNSEIPPRDVLEYVVFENHLADTYGKWRLHAKTVPDWLQGGSNQIIKTFATESLNEPDPTTEPDLVDHKEELIRKN
ncbi:unnamed protein product [Gordionus sp. m RMFG-2023]|uniref:large ribosomal subunit protein mL45-like n=1 Tax=Gordionus sp. m RMFG-2023 TaxID=3053472 RepID=UPI0030E4F791